jgi:hypothetical protein
VKIKDVLAKIAKGEELSESEKAFIGTYEEPDLDAAANARSKKERLKHEAKREELDAKILELEAEAEDAKAGGSDLDKLQREVEKLTAKNEQATQLLDAEKTARAESQRGNALGKVKIPWMDGVNDSYRQTVLNSAFEGIDTEDLSDATVTGSIIEKIVADNASFINSGKSGGAGTGADEKGGKPNSGKFTAENVGQLRGKELIENLDAAWAAASQGA